MHALITLHDVMPDTMSQILDLIGDLPASSYPCLTLLVVPGLPWQESQLTQLQLLAALGIRLAGHGWLHRAAIITSHYHKLHARLISRNTAEHLSLNASQLQTMIRNCHTWFARHGLATPDYYVPPAWAMGSISGTALSTLPFRYYESTSGITDAWTGQFKRLPLVGFEADTPLRRLALKTWNLLNGLLSTPSRPLRIAIHPHDKQLLMAEQMQDLLATVTSYQDYRSLFTGTE